MSEVFSFRAATVLDAECVAVIHRLARDAAMPWLPALHTPSDDLAFFRDEVLPAGGTELGMIAGQSVGFCVRQNEWIDHLYLLPSAWRSGLGSAFLHRCKNASPRLQLWTFQRNDMARRFYENHGFVEAEFTDGSQNEENEPDVRYVWERHETA